MILGARGPVVIDWPNAARGPAAADVAHTWIVMACSVPTTGRYRQAAARAGGRLFVALFLRHYDRARSSRTWRAVATWRTRAPQPSARPSSKRSEQMVDRYG